MRLPALLPDDYLPDVNMRMSIYKRIASTSTQDELDDLRIELIDRFGLLPPPTQNLLQLASFRQQATRLGVKRIDLGPQGGYIDFAEQPQVNPAWLVGLLQSQPRVYRLDGPTRLRLQMPTADAKTRLQRVQDLLTDMARNTRAL